IIPVIGFRFALQSAARDYTLLGSLAKSSFIAAAGFLFFMGVSLLRSEGDEILCIASSLELSYNTNYLRIPTDTLFPDDVEPPLLYSGKIFTTWEACESFLNKWAKLQA
ncbi:13507_t:CDS:2, partial [Gigaspora rosea]